MRADGSEAHVECAVIQSVRLGSVCACFFSLCVALLATGCARGPSTLAPAPSTSVSISLSSTTASVQAGIGTQSFTATVQNDSQSKGVSWALTQSGASCSPGCGTLSSTISASGTPITYAAPPKQPNPSEVTLTAASVADTSKTVMSTITVTPPVVASVSPPSQKVNVMSTQDFTATLQNDFQHKGVIWSLSGAGCSGATCGTLSSPSSASDVAITYAAPSIIPNPAIVTLTAISINDGTRTSTATITIVPPISVTAAPVNQQLYVNHAHQFSATLANDFRNSGVTWSLSGAGCSGATCGTLSSPSSASDVAIAYSAPASSLGSSVSLTATSVSDRSKSSSSTITILAIPPNISVSLTPKRGGISTSQTFSFSASVSNDTLNLGVTWEVDAVPGGSSSSLGTIDSNGKYTPPTSGTIGGIHTITATSIADVTKNASAMIGVTDLPGVFTYHNDAQRTGVNQQEYALTTSNVTSATFGKLFSCAVDAAVYAQPLWVANLTIGSAAHNVVYVATQRDTVYAFDADADPCVTYWQTGANGVNSLIPSGETWVTSLDVSCGDLEPDIGIAGTPVINPVTMTMYVVTKTKVSGTTTLHQRLHALDLLTGSEKFNGPIDIQATVSGTGGGSSGGSLSFDAMINNQRPALLLSNDAGGKHVLISWASHCDFGQYHGWLISYNAGTLAREAVFNVSPNGMLGGIWMSGNGPAADVNGNVYLATGNGTFDVNAGGTSYGDTDVKLGPQTGGSFPVSDYFTPLDQWIRNVNDGDLGSGGVLLLPDTSGITGHPHLLVQAGKGGNIFLVDRDNMGHFCSTCTTTDTQIVQEVQGAIGGMWGSPAYWNGNLYFGGSGDTLKAFSVSANTTSPLSSGPTSQSLRRFTFPGTTPSVSSNGNANSIVWALDNSQYCTTQSSGCGPAVLFAYDATNLGNEFWDSTQSLGDQAGHAVKFTVPTVANGKVYIGTRGSDSTNGGAGELDVYGLKPN